MRKPKAQKSNKSASKGTNEGVLTKGNRRRLAQEEIGKIIQAKGDCRNLPIEIPKPQLLPRES